MDAAAFDVVCVVAGGGCFCAIVIVVALSANIGVLVVVVTIVCVVVVVVIVMCFQSIRMPVLMLSSRLSVLLVVSSPPLLPLTLLSIVVTIVVLLVLGGCCFATCIFKAGYPSGTELFWRYFRNANILPECKHVSRMHIYAFRMRGVTCFQMHARKSSGHPKASSAPR